MSACITTTNSGAIPKVSATICGIACTVDPDPISTPAATSVALPSAFRLIVAADGPTKTNQVPTASPRPSAHPAGAAGGVLGRIAMIVSKSSLWMLPSKT
ncbi:unannotated protein [freshwater metagenome]|uniref:Unannotated protein n=1 Tax=freshwater metagenome TaxID=449393 RepID=A0A6J7AJP3_9ZZZZ